MVIGIITILALVVSLVLLVIIANQAAKNKWQASFTPSGHMEFVVAGEKPIRTLLNVEGYYLHRGDGEFVIRVGEVVKDETEEFVIPRDNENPEEVLKLPKIEGRPTQVPVVNAIEKNWARASCKGNTGFTGSAGYGRSGSYINSMCLRLNFSNRRRSEATITSRILSSGRKTSKIRPLFSGSFRDR